MCIPQMSHKSYSVNHSRATPGAKQETAEDPPGELQSRVWVLALPFQTPQECQEKQGMSRNRSWKAGRGKSPLVSGSEGSEVPAQVTEAPRCPLPVTQPAAIVKPRA